MRHGSARRRLAALVGRWRTGGRTRETADAPATTIDAVDTYEWLPGRFVLFGVASPARRVRKLDRGDLQGNPSAHAARPSSKVGAPVVAAYTPVRP
jgi:hypothetical protein